VDVYTVMKNFSALMPNLQPYGEVTNEVRVRSIQDSVDIKKEEVDRRVGLTIVVLNLNKPELVSALQDGFLEVHKIFLSAGITCEMIIGDTGSTEARTLELLATEIEGRSVKHAMKYQFSRCNNEVFDLVNTQTVLFLNNDVLINENPESVKMAYDLLHANINTAAVSAVLHFENGTLQHGGIDFLHVPSHEGFCYHPGAHQQWVSRPGESFSMAAGTGAFLMLRSELFAEVGRFDESYQAECQDVDLCLKLKRLGYDIQIGDFGRLVHLENATRPTGEENWEDRALYMRRWSGFVSTL
jgi:GT2 family glycosyltransferase